MTDWIISALAGCGIMAWILWFSAMWLRYQENKPTRRQENQQQRVNEIVGLMRAAKKTSMVFAVAPGKEFDEALQTPCKRPRTRGRRPA